MTLHAAKGLEFDTVFLPGWEEGLFPSQRTMDENGLAGLEEERRLAYVGLTRAKKRIRISFAANRRMRGMWQSSLPSRFISEIPEDHVETTVDEGFYGGYVGFRDNAPNAGNFGSTYDSPGWRRAQANRANVGANRTRPPTIEAQAWTVQTRQESYERQTWPTSTGSCGSAIGDPMSASSIGPRISSAERGPTFQVVGAMI